MAEPMSYYFVDSVSLASEFLQSHPDRYLMPFLHKYLETLLFAQSFCSEDGCRTFGCDRIVNNMKMLDV